MLDVALKFLETELNTYLFSKTGSSAVAAKLTNLVDDSGKYAFDPQTLGLCLINVEEERTLKAQLPEHTFAKGQHLVLEPPLRLNLHLLIAAQFRVYEEALKYLAHVLAFFQGRNNFTPDTYPGLDPRIEKLVAELQSLTYDQLNQVWTYQGAKYLPSLLYKLRLVVIQDASRLQVQPPITTVHTELHS